MGYQKIFSKFHYGEACSLSQSRFNSGVGSVGLFQLAFFCLLVYSIYLYILFIYIYIISLYFTVYRKTPNAQKKRFACVKTECVDFKK